MRSRTMTQRTISSEPLRARLAVAAGSAVRKIGLGIPGTVGPGLVVASLAAYDWRIGGLVAGAILWMLDRRVP